MKIVPQDSVAWREAPAMAPDLSPTQRHMHLSPAATEVAIRVPYERFVGPTITQGVAT